MPLWTTRGRFQREHDIDRKTTLTDVTIGTTRVTALTHLQRLEAESMQSMREVVAECRRPVLLYSSGKNSSLMLHLRFRTLGCYPLTGAVESHAATLPAIIQEMLSTRQSGRQGRVIDHDQAGSMETEQEGCF